MLAEMLVFVAEKLDGLVLFGGLIDCSSSPPSSLKVIQWLEDGRDWSEHCGTPDAVRWWLRQPNFRMVK